MERRQKVRTGDINRRYLSSKYLTNKKKFSVFRYYGKTPLEATWQEATCDSNIEIVFAESSIRRFYPKGGASLLRHLLKPITQRSLKNIHLFESISIFGEKFYLWLFPRNRAVKPHQSVTLLFTRGSKLNFSGIGLVLPGSDNPTALSRLSLISSTSRCRKKNYSTN